MLEGSTLQITLDLEFRNWSEDIKFSEENLYSALNINWYLDVKMLGINIYLSKAFNRNKILEVYNLVLDRYV